MKKISGGGSVKRHYAGKYPIDVDGVRVNFGDGWGLVRASNTQPALVLRFEADTKERLNEIQAEMESVVRANLLEATQCQAITTKGTKPRNFLRELYDFENLICTELE